MDAILNFILINNANGFSKQVTFFSIDNGILFWGAIIIGCLIIVIIILTWLLVRREKTLQLLAFSVSPTGLKLTFELNKDEKIKLLAKENINLQQEIKTLEKTLGKEKWRSLIVMIILLFVAIIDKLKSKK